MPEPLAQGVLSVPFAASFTGVPLSGFCQRFRAALHPLRREGSALVGHVLNDVIVAQDARQIAEVVVEGILVLVMDVVALWDRAVGGLPNLLMEAPDASLLVGDSGREVDAVRPSFGVWIAAEGDAVEHDDFGSCHVTSLSR